MDFTIKYCSVCGNELHTKPVPDDYGAIFDPDSGERKTHRVCINPTCKAHYNHDWITQPLWKRFFGVDRICAKCGAEDFDSY